MRGAEHENIVLRSAVRQPVGNVLALDLDDQILVAHQVTAQQGFAQLPIGLELVRGPVNDDGVAVGHLVDRYRLVPVPSDDDPGAINLPPMSRDLATDGGGTLLIGMMDRCGNYDLNDWVLRRQILGMEAIGIFLGDKIGRNVTLLESRVGD